MRRTLAVVVLGLVVVTAGCGGGTTGTPSAASPTTSAAPPATDGAGTGDVSYPPGVDEQGVTDPDALFAAHRSELSGRSLQVSIRYVVTTNGSGQRTNFTGRVDPTADRALLHVDARGGTADYYVEGNDSYVRQVVGTETRYRTGADVSGLVDNRLGSDRFVESALRTANFTPTGTVTRDGTELLELSVTAVESQFGTGGRNGTRTVEGRLLVDEDGVVHHVTVRATIETAAGGRYEYGIVVDVSAVGATSVDRPDWLDEARDGS